MTEEDDAKLVEWRRAIDDSKLVERRPMTEEEAEREAARGEFVRDHECLKTGKKRLKDDDLNFIARQNAYMYDELSVMRQFGLWELSYTIREELTKLREAQGWGVGETLLVCWIAFFLPIQTWLLYRLAVQLGAIVPG